MKLIILLDCNNFYVSCERAFNPRLQGLPVVVLSNNDGCVIARSDESKALGITMGVPYYQIRALVQREHVFVHSANFALYGDMSRRIMHLLAMKFQNLEVYSIDEAFAVLNYANAQQAIDDCEVLREWLYRCTGIPVSIGLAATKVLAKLASQEAKSTTSGVFYLQHHTSMPILQRTPVSMVWGIGPRLALQLKALGIETAWQLQQADPMFMRQYLHRGVQEIVWELQARACMQLTQEQAPKSIMGSRSFGAPVTTWDDMAQAISHYTAGVAAKARRWQLQAATITIFLRSCVAADGAASTLRTSLALPVPSNDTSCLIKAAKTALLTLYRTGTWYRKAGVILQDLSTEALQQQCLFDKPTSPRRANSLISFDRLNQHYGQQVVFFAAQGIQRTWQMKQQFMSPRYTTSWDELVLVYCH